MMEREIDSEARILCYCESNIFLETYQGNVIWNISKFRL